MVYVTYEQENVTETLKKGEKIIKLIKNEISKINSNTS